MFLFASLGSGSEGNSFLIKTDKTIFMVDCGFNYKETENRLSELGLTFSDINHILITHEHEDHMRAIKMIIKKEKIQISCSYGTAKKIGIVDEVNIINPGDIVVDNDLQAEAVPVPHDAREPCHYVFKKDTLKIGIITDFGSLTPKIIESYSNLNLAPLRFGAKYSMPAKIPMFPLKYLLTLNSPPCPVVSNCLLPASKNRSRGFLNSPYDKSPHPRPTVISKSSFAV